MDPIMMELVWEIINEVKPVLEFAPPGCACPGDGAAYFGGDEGMPSSDGTV